MQPFLFEVEKGKVRRQALSHAGEEFVYVLEGEIKFRVGNIEYRLGPGDSLYFDSEAEHEVTPVSKKALYLGIFHEPPAPEEKGRLGRRSAAGKGATKP
jgi:quercetin dioxygenase-like cupin family protein